MTNASRWKLGAVLTIVSTCVVTLILVPIDAIMHVLKWYAVSVGIAMFALIVMQGIFVRVLKLKTRK